MRKRSSGSAFHVILKTTDLPLRALTITAALSAGVFASGARAQARPPPGPSTAELANRAEQIFGQLKNAEDNLRVVETQYSERGESTPDELFASRFSAGEIQYLLQDYPGASVLFYDLVSDPRFKTNEKYPDALRYLSEALYEQKNLVGAKVYLRELMQLKGRHYKEALTRYLEIAGRLNDFTGIDEYIQAAREASGALPPEVAYVYGKWLFKRDDLSAQDRVARAQQAFAPLVAANGPYRLQAAYYIGVAHVKARDFDAAARQFMQVATATPQSPREAKVKELANLSLGRILYENAKYDEAIDRYQELPRGSEYFVDSLYEIAWAFVKKNEYERAKNATDLLLLVAPDSTLAPEAKTLQGHLLLKLQRYAEATDTYNQVINDYAPVRDELDALLTVNKDPVRYFDELLAKNEKNLDVTSLLPPTALKWATTEREVAQAMQMVSDIEAGKRGVQDSQEIASRILKALDERGMETFPALQEGYTRADALDTALTQIDQSLVRIEEELLRGQLTAAEQQELQKLRASQVELEKKFRTLPKTPEEVEARRRRMREQIDHIDKEAFQLGYDVQSMFAALTAIEKWVIDTRAQRSSGPEEEKAFLARLKHETELLELLRKELTDLRKVLADQRAGADAAIGGEELIRQKLKASLQAQHELFTRAGTRLPGDAARVLSRTQEIRARADQLEQRLAAAKQKLREQVARRGQQIRDVVLAEQAALKSYGQEVQTVSSDARHLVGRIAFDSFQRVRNQFYELVLKADVGVVDVAFTRKQDKTSQIQKISTQKDRELKALDEEFKEVLKDVDEP